VQREQSEPIKPRQQIEDRVTEQGQRIVLLDGDFGHLGSLLLAMLLLLGALLVGIRVRAALFRLRDLLGVLLLLVLLLVLVAAAAALAAAAGWG
jgi:hypothetical protein